MDARAALAKVSAFTGRSKTTTFPSRERTPLAMEERWPTALGRHNDDRDIRPGGLLVAPSKQRFYAGPGECFLGDQQAADILLQEPTHTFQVGAYFTGCAISNQDLLDDLGVPASGSQDEDPLAHGRSVLGFGRTAQQLETALVGPQAGQDTIEIDQGFADLDAVGTQLHFPDGALVSACPALDDRRSPS